MNGAIEVLVIKHILVVPNSDTWVGHFVTHEPDAVVSRVRLVPAHCRARARPSHDSRLHPHGGPDS